MAARHRLLAQLLRRKPAVATASLEVESSCSTSLWLIRTCCSPTGGGPVHPRCAEPHPLSSAAGGSEAHQPSSVASIQETLAGGIAGNMNVRCPSVPRAERDAARIYEPWGFLKVVKEEPQNESALSALSQLYLEGGRREDASVCGRGAVRDGETRRHRSAMPSCCWRSETQSRDVQMRIITEN